MSAGGAVTEDVQRVPRAQLLKLSETGRDCEACGRHMHDHQWADLDSNGFVVACSEQERKEIDSDV